MSAAGTVMTYNGLTVALSLAYADAHSTIDFFEITQLLTGAHPPSQVECKECTGVWVSVERIPSSSLFITAVVCCLLCNTSPYRSVLM